MILFTWGGCYIIMIILKFKILIEKEFEKICDLCFFEKKIKMYLK